MTVEPFRPRVGIGDVGHALDANLNDLEEGSARLARHVVRRSPGDARRVVGVGGVERQVRPACRVGEQVHHGGPRGALDLQLDAELAEVTEALDGLTLTVAPEEF